MSRQNVLLLLLLHAFVTCLPLPLKAIYLANHPSINRETKSNQVKIEVLILAEER